MISKPMVWLGILLGVAVVFALLRLFGPDARERRRRERSYGRVVSRKRGPWVRLAVRLRRPKADRKG